MCDEEVAAENVVAALRAEACRIEEDCETSHAAHTEAARLASGLHLWLGLGATVIASASGVFSFSASGSTAGPTPLGTVAGILAFGVAALSGVMTFLDPKSRTSTHYQAGIAYATLRTDARYFRTIECEKCPRPQDLEKQMAALLIRWKELDKQTPHVSSRALVRAQVRILTGEYSGSNDCPEANSPPNLALQRTPAADALSGQS